MSQTSEYKPPRKGARADFEEVLSDEIELIEMRRGLRDDRPPAATDPSRGAYEQAFDADLVGLSFSGGGIRSATFNLGVIQALARLKLLSLFDYLSTVSGGGYIGSWLTGIIHRESQGNPRGIHLVEAKLGSGGEDSDLGTVARTEEHAISFLRQFSNYLTPRVGFFSADTWAVITTYLRNLILVLSTLVVGIALVLLLPRGLEALVQAVMTSRLPLALALVPLVAAVLAVIVVGVNLGRSSKEGTEGWVGDAWYLKQPWVLLLVVLPLFVGAVGGALGLAHVDKDVGWALVESLGFIEESVPGASVGWLRQQIDGKPWLLTVVLTGIAYAASWAFSALIAWRTTRKWPTSVNFARLILWGVPAGCVGGLMLAGIDRVLADAIETAGLWRALTWGAPLILVGYVLTASVHTGLVGRHLHDYHREWLSRVGAWLLIFSMAWVALFAATVYGSVAVYWTTDWLRWALTAGWLGATLAGLLAGRSGGNGAGGKPGIVRAAIGKVTPYIFIVGLLLWLGVGLDRVLSLERARGGEPWQEFMASRHEIAERLEKDEISACCSSLLELIGSSAGTPTDAPETVEIGGGSAFGLLVKAHWSVLEASSLRMLCITFLSLLVVFSLLGWRVDVNEFSMHRLYRNRLVRCYLGATVDPRKREERRQPFTGFNMNDDIPLENLGILQSDQGQARPPGSGGFHAGPYHLVNVALNLVSGRELAWQERKAASFIFSPLYCGFGVPRLRSGYRRTPGYGSTPKRLTLGTAMAISGAAASPNMGFRTSPALSFLLTLFNVRLGWWLGNPSLDSKTLLTRNPFWTLSGPPFAARRLVGELFGLTREDSSFVYLSDGGHFENLGVYELVRRRCRFIVACDAGADPGLQFDDLGNAIRKCRADLGIEIEISPSQIRLAEDGLSRWHWAVGTIHYGGERKGTLLYLKSSLTGDEPEDILNYNAENQEFPHQTTGDQWFDESQFESYRRLGEHVALGALQAAVAEVSDGGETNLERLAQVLRDRWHPPRTGGQEVFTRHSEKLDGLYETLRTSEPLQFLSRQFYPEWPSLMTGEPSSDTPSWLPPQGEEGEEQRRHGFYFCNSLIQLMEDVYLDLDLEEEWDHPDNRGWLNLFRHWAWSGMFQATWGVSASNHGLRFQKFCRRWLNLETFCNPEVVALLPQRSTAGPIDLQEFDNLPKDQAGLNFVERDIIRGVLENDNCFDQIFRFEVVVKREMGEALDESELVRFGCGFALSDGPRIVCFRIQDHLRRMGLARRTLKRLLADHALDQRPRFVNPSSEHEGLFPRQAQLRFLELFRSVKREIEHDRASSPGRRRGQKEC